MAGSPSRWLPVKCGVMKVYRVKLAAEERAQLGALLAKGKSSARTLMHARILLKTDEGIAGPRLTDEEIAAAVEVNRSTVERVRMRCGEGEVEAALRPRPSRQGASAQVGWRPGSTPGGLGLQPGTERSGALVTAPASRQAGGTCAGG